MGSGRGSRAGEPKNAPCRRTGPGLLTPVGAGRRGRYPAPGARVSPFLTATSKSDTLRNSGSPGTTQVACLVTPGVPCPPWGSRPNEERKRNVAESVKVSPEQRMLLDGKLVEADSGRTFENFNPATEE